MTTATRLYSALSKQMERKFNALSRITELFDEEGITYYIPQDFRQEVIINVFSRKYSGIQYIIEPTLEGYKLTANYRNWEKKINVDFKIIERVNAETIVNNLKRIDEDASDYYSDYFNEKQRWKERRAQLRRNQVIQELSGKNTSA